MAPAPIPADPTLLSSPLSNSRKHPASACVSSSRRHATAVALSSIQETLSQETESATSTAAESSASLVKDTQTLINSDSLSGNELHASQPSRNTSELLPPGVTNIQFGEKTKNFSNVIIESDNERESSLVHEVQRSYNRLSLNNKNKQRNLFTLKRKQQNYNSIESGPDTIKRPRLEPVHLNQQSILTTEFSSCSKASTKANTEISMMMNGHSNKILETRYSSATPTLSNSNSGSQNLALAAQPAGNGKITNSPPPIASLSNLGNTCFLNSVLYTLRFTPGFLHSLHHLINDLGLAGNNGSCSNGGSKHKRGGLMGSSSNNMASNGCGTGSSGCFNNSTMIGGSSLITNADSESETTLTLDVVDQLHDLFRNMSIFDETPESNREPIPPNNFLQAVGKLNPMFEGNQQQDAHELLVTVLNTLQDIKIPVPASNNIATADVIDHPSGGGKGHGETESHNGGGKKGKQKKTGKSIFYSGSGSSIQCNSTNSLSSSSSSFVSNGFRSSPSKTDYTDSGVGLGSSFNRGATNIQLNQLPAGEATLLPNFVKENFVGKSVMRTRCLECEASTYRSETFTNIDIPLTFEANDCHISGSEQEGNDCQSDVKDLFLKQIMASETLRENNKYWCSECSRLNEAQRSVQYELLPQIMVLQLKRFTATGTKSSYMSKINDHIPTPFTMNCFCTQCLPNGSYIHPSAISSQHSQQNTSKHHYRLYAVIMHLGATLASGHYTAYVRANNQTWEYLQCQRGNGGSRSNCNSAERIKGTKTSDRNGSSGGGKGIMKYFSRNSNSSETRQNIMNCSNSSSGSSCNGYHSSASIGSSGSDGCRSANCCGLRTASQISLSGDSHSSVKSSSSVSMSSVADSQTSEKISASGPHHQRSLDSVDSAAENNLVVNGHQDLVGGQQGDSGVSFLSSSASSNASASEETWLECDDETIHVISRRQFEEELKPNRGYTTPYLLFYEKVI